MKQVQIVSFDRETNRWRFVAHGAAYDMESATRVKQSVEARKGKVKFLPIPADKRQE
jgi:hypothetical protein